MILKTRKLICNIYFVLPFLSILIFSSCAREDTRNEIIAQAKADGRLLIDLPNHKTLVEISSEDLFRAIYFYEGEITTQVEYLNNIKQFFDEKMAEQNIDVQQITAFRNEIIDGIQILSPTFFDNLKSAVLQSDHFLLKSLLIEGSTLYIESAMISSTFGLEFSNTIALANSINSEDYDLSTKSGIDSYHEALMSAVNSGGDIGMVGLFLAFVVAVAVWSSAVFVNVAVALTALAWAYAALPIAPPSGDSDIQLDYYTRSIIEGLSD